MCYTHSSNTAWINHNLGVVPELAIRKTRSATGNWEVAAVNPNDKTLYFTGQNAGSSFALNLTNGWGTSYPSSDYLSDTQFKANTWFNNPTIGTSCVTYLFASCPGVSKVGSYTGTGSTQTISCGFTGGARFVLIKRTDSTGDWYVWDTARGMVAGTDPSLLLNSTAAEVNANSVYTTTGGFQIVSTAAGINASGGSYIYLAIA